MPSLFTEIDILKTEIKNKDKEILELKAELEVTISKMNHFDSKQNKLKNKLQRARKKDFWIDVKEYLPPFDELVFVAFKTLTDEIQYTSARYVNQKVCAHSETRVPTWWVEVSRGHELRTVLFWQPIVKKELIDE